MSRKLIFAFASGVVLSMSACGSGDAPLDSFDASTALITQTPPPKPDAAPPKVDGGVSTQTATYVRGSFQTITPSIGTAVKIGVGDASPWIVGTGANNIYHYNNDSAPPRAWVQDSTAAASGIAVSPGGTPWKLDTNGHVFVRTSSGTWVQQGTLQAYELGVGAGTAVWAISRSCSADCSIYKWNGSTWSPIGGGAAAQHVAVSPEGNVYVTNSAGTIYKWNGTSFVHWGGTGCAEHNSLNGAFGVPVIGAGPNDSVWVIGCDVNSSVNKSIYAWSTNLGTWQQVYGSAYTISVGADGTAWVINGATNAIYEYVSSWQFVGPNGFTFYDPSKTTNRTWSGEVHDVAVGQGDLIVGATSGGVWQLFGLNPWRSIGDVGAGVTAQGTAPPTGPNMSVGTVAVKPSDAATVLAGTGVADQVVNNGTNRTGNGLWYTRTATAATVSWQEALCGGSRCPSPMVKVRYSTDSSKVYLATQNGLYVATDTGGALSFTNGSGCAPSGQFTDLVVDPNNSNVVYLGVTGNGVMRATFSGTTCTPSVSTPPLYSGTASSITNVALAVTSGTVLYASVAGATYAGGDFQGISSTSSGTWPAWSLVIAGPNTSGLNSQGGHDWALATDPTGATILAGGVTSWLFTGCSSSGCTTATNQDTPASPGTHHDFHALLWTSSNVYAVNDGGVFDSTTNAATWDQTINTVGVANQVSVAVAPGKYYVSAWDMGGYYSLDSGSTWIADYHIEGTDGHQMLVDPASTSNAFHCESSTNASARYGFDGTSWAEKDSSPIGLGSASCNLAKGLNGNLLTLNQAGVYQSLNLGTTWEDYNTNPLPATPYAIYASNEASTSVYVQLGSAPTNVLNLYVSANGGAWQYATQPTGWQTGYLIQAPNVALDPITSDLYVIGSNSNLTHGLVYTSAVSSHGTSWLSLTGVGGLAFRTNELPESLAIDPSARAVIVAAEGIGGAGIWRLNNRDVQECPLCTETHHWRPWVQGLPNTQQPAEWVTGQYEDGVYVYYAATWGRGLWKREARGGDF